MNFKDMLDKLSLLSEATKETEKGRVHKADPGGYGRKYDTDEDGDEKDGDKDAKKPSEKRGRGRPAKTGAHVSSPAEKKTQQDREKASKDLQSFIVGNVPKKSTELDKLPKKKHSLKEFFEQIDEERMLREAEQVTIQPAQQKTQVIKQGTKTLGTVENPSLANTIKSAIGKGEMSLAGDELGEEAKNTYAIGMAAAKKKFGYGSKPAHDLPKKVIKKGHEIAKKIHEVEQPTPDNMSAMGAGLGAGRNHNALEEAKKTVKKDDKAEKAGKKVAKDIEHDEKVKDKIHGKKRHAEDEKAERAGKKVAKDIEYDSKKKKAVKEAAKPDFPDIDDDGNKKESIKKAAQDAKKKKLKENAHRHSSARLMGKAHALAKEGYNCKYEDMEEAKMYHEGYKEGLDECYGLMPMRGVVVGEEMPATVPGMASQAMPAMEDDMEEGNAFTAALKRTPKGGKFSVGGNTFTDTSNYEESMAFESLDKQLNDLLTEGERVEEGMSVSISKGQQGSPDSVTVSAQDSEAEKLLGFIKQVGLGLFGDEGRSDYGSPMSVEPKQTHGDIEVVDDHDGMMSLMKKMSGMDQGGEDYRDEEHHEEMCEVCGESECGYHEGQEMVDEFLDNHVTVKGTGGSASNTNSNTATGGSSDATGGSSQAKSSSGASANSTADGRATNEVQTYDQEEEEVAENDTEELQSLAKTVPPAMDEDIAELQRLAGTVPQREQPAPASDQKRGMQEDNPPDSGEAESTADEDAEAAEDKALALKSVNEGGDGGEASEETEDELDEGVVDTIKRGAAAGLLGLGLAAGGMGGAKAASPDQMKPAAVHTVTKDQFKGAPTFVAGKHFSIPAAPGKTTAYFGSGHKSHSYVLIDVNSLEQAPKPGPNAKYVFLKMPDKGYGGKTVKAYAPDEKGSELYIINSTNESAQLDEWANDAGKRGTETALTMDEDYMLNTITSGLNKRKATGQTTIPVIPGQKDRMGSDGLNEWKRLAGITR